MRKQGLACDHLVSADVVTADGRLVRAGGDGDPELLWGLRGGGGNFGVVTALELQLQPVGPMVYGGILVFAGERAADVASFYADWTAGGLPDELTTILNLTTAPPAPFLPESIHGKPAAVVAACYAGPAEDGERALAPVRALGEPVADLLQPLPYVAMQQLLDPLWGRGARNHMKAGYLGDLDSGAIDALLRGWEAKPSPMSELHVHHMGGAAARVCPATSSAFPHRDAPYVANFISRWTESETDDEQIGWGRDVYSSLGRAHDRRRLHQLPLRRGAGSRSRGLRRRGLRPAAGAQAQLRPRQCLPPQPERRPCLARVRSRGHAVFPLRRTDVASG